MIWEELRGLTSHPTADELYERVKKRLPRISLGTVYRNLEFLWQRGMVRKIEGGGAEAIRSQYGEPLPLPLSQLWPGQRFDAGTDP